MKANPAAWPDIEADILDNRTGRQETIDLSKSLFPHLHEQAKRLPKAKIVALMKQELGIA